MSGGDAVLFEVSNRIATVTLNRPDNRNSMTQDVLAGLADAVAKLRADTSLRCAIVTGRGSSFCAGADFKSRGGPGQPSDSDAPPQAPHERSYATYAPFLSILDVEIPVIAAMQGHAIGGGFGLALVCDLRVANREAKYGANFVRLGLSPGMATTYLLPRLVGLPRALELLLTGRIVTGAEAAQLGLANDAVAAEAVLPRARELAREIATAAPNAVRWTKHLVYAGVGWDPRSAARIEAHYQSRTFESDDFREGVAALLGKREPKFEGR
ncbi:MAG TPA: enoyl-CoA hydratase/isomerase family protein [Myxococcota bacterium]|nr:enoyl-CoA hydratase/isomerase family protein [Myxococcota bacterium]